MTTASKTIGPMRRDWANDWVLNPIGYLCGAVLRERFNIPDTAQTLWVELTERRPLHRDAIRVRLNRFGDARLDNDRTLDFYIVRSMRAQANDFGNDFYATIYYE